MGGVAGTLSGKVHTWHRSMIPLEASGTAHSESHGRRGEDGGAILDEDAYARSESQGGRDKDGDAILDNPGTL